MTLALRYAARSDVGLLRGENEDSMYAGPRLLAVADGMGGHAAGEVASRVVIETMAELDATPPQGDLPAAIRTAVESANGYLRDMVAADGSLEGMGTTLTALLWVEQQLILAHIGDSRAYLFRDGALEQVTHDHTLVQNLIDEGRLTPDEASTHPQRSWITRALDGRPDVDLDLSHPDPHVGDRYLICSDGLSSYVSEETIADTLATDDPQQACDQLIALALRAGGPDNITCIVADLVDDDASDGRPIVGGAAAAADHVAAPAPDSPAARAAAIGTSNTAATPADRTGTARSRPAEPAEDDDEDDDAAQSGREGSSRRVVAVLVSVLILIGLGVLGTFLYVRTQYYVGVADGSPQTVGVFRGVTGSALGIDLSRLTDQTDLPVTALPAYEQPRVRAGIPASGHDDARRIVTTLRGEACPSPTPTPTPTRKASRKHRHPAASPSPTPTPSPPPYCTGPS